MKKKDRTDKRDGYLVTPLGMMIGNRKLARINFHDLCDVKIKRGCYLMTALPFIFTASFARYLFS